jgi:aspartyl-tRNA(Asn)/glutamyl-tRNA(Gln) amidotransferase subunit A
MDCIGPLAHSAVDCAIAMDVISGWDQNDTTTCSIPGKHYPLGQLKTEKIRIGIDRQLIETADDHTVSALEDVEDHLKQLGALINEVSLQDIELLNDLQQVLVKCEGAAYHGSKIRQTPDQVSLETRSVIQEGFVISATRYLEAQCLRPKLLERFNAQAFADVEVLLLPAASGEVPLYKPSNQCEADEIEANFTATARFTRFANYLGLPCIAFPVGLAKNGLPIAAQLLGKPWSETCLLQIVDAYQNLMGQENGFPYTPLDQQR